MKLYGLLPLALPLGVAAVLSLAPAGALADPGPPGAGVRAELLKRFAAADHNGDSRLSREEARDGMPRVYRHFDAIDTAHAGSVSRADIAAYLAAQQRRAKP